MDLLYQILGEQYYMSLLSHDLIEYFFRRRFLLGILPTQPKSTFKYVERIGNATNLSMSPENDIFYVYTGDSDFLEIHLDAYSFVDNKHSKEDKARTLNPNSPFSIIRIQDDYLFEHNEGSINVTLISKKKSLTYHIKVAKRLISFEVNAELMIVGHDGKFIYVIDFKKVMGNIAGYKRVYQLSKNIDRFISLCGHNAQFFIEHYIMSPYRGLSYYPISKHSK